ncbi:hypothetical protein PUN28_020937 [Cardiocondyla obscurior]|uniref:Uncharacterized protein n=1 Tax=Cardiocondyla obscurior TaxID=286306 RepID=A0AAW2E673_9HYME
MANEPDFEEIEQSYFENFRSHMEEVEKNQQPSPCDKETAAQQQPPPRPKKTAAQQQPPPRPKETAAQQQPPPRPKETAAQQQPPPRPKETVQSAHHSLLQEEAAIPSAETTNYLLQKIQELEAKLKRRK